MISNIETNEKLPLLNDHLWLVVSFLVPAYTVTVPARHTVACSCDIMSHYLEQYFVKAISPVAEGFIEGVLRTVLRAPSQSRHAHPLACGATTEGRPLLLYYLRPNFLSRWGRRSARSFSILVL